MFAQIWQRLVWTQETRQRKFDGITIETSADREGRWHIGNDVDLISLLNHAMSVFSSALLIRLRKFWLGLIFLCFSLALRASEHVVDTFIDFSFGKTLHSMENMHIVFKERELSRANQARWKAYHELLVGHPMRHLHTTRSLGHRQGSKHERSNELFSCHWLSANEPAVHQSYLVAQKWWLVCLLWKHHLRDCQRKFVPSGRSIWSHWHPWDELKRKCTRWILTKTNDLSKQIDCLIIREKSHSDSSRSYLIRRFDTWSAFAYASTVKGIFISQDPCRIHVVYDLCTNLHPTDSVNIQTYASIHLSNSQLLVWDGGSPYSVPACKLERTLVASTLRMRDQYRKIYAWIHTNRSSDLQTT